MKVKSFIYTILCRRIRNCIGCNKDLANENTNENEGTEIGPKIIEEIRKSPHPQSTFSGVKRLLNRPRLIFKFSPT